MLFSRYFHFWTRVNFLWICVLFLWQTLGSVIEFNITKVVSCVRIATHIKQSGFIPVALQNCSLFLDNFSKENLCNVSGLFSSSNFFWRHSFFVRRCLISSLNLSVSDTPSKWDIWLDFAFYKWSKSILWCRSCSFLFYGCSLNIEGTLAGVTLPLYPKQLLDLNPWNGTRTQVFFCLGIFIKRVCASFPPNMLQHIKLFLS